MARQNEHEASINYTRHTTDESEQCYKCKSYDATQKYCNKHKIKANKLGSCDFAECEK
jgi:hypothetical protein